MKRFIAVVLTAVMVLGLAGSLPVRSEAAPAVSDAEWSDDFSADTIADYKTTGPDNGAWGNWHVSDGKLKVTGNQGANWWGTMLLLGNVSYKDFVMEFDANVGAGYGVVLRAQDDASTAGEGLNKWFSGNAYVIWHNRPVESDAAITVYDHNGSQTVVRAAQSAAAAGHVHWRIVAEGSDFVVDVTNADDGSAIASFSFSDSRYASGMVGFYNLTKEGLDTFAADNLKVTPINSTLFEDDFSDPDLGEYFTAGPDNGIWGSWAVADGRLQVTGNAGAQFWGTSILTNADYDNFIMEFDAPAVNTGYGVLLRAGDDGEGDKTGLNAWNSGDTYNLMHNLPVESNANIEVKKFTGSSETIGTLAGVGAMSAAHWKIAAWGDMIAFRVTDMNDASHSFEYIIKDSSYTAGHVGFYNLVDAGVTRLKVDNLTIKGYKAPDAQPEPVKKSLEWTDDFNHGKGGAYTAYGWWWNDYASSHSGTDYTGTLGNEGGDESGITYYYLKDYIFDDFTMEFDVVNVAAGAQYGVVLRAGNPGAGADQGDGYIVMYDGSWMFAGRIDGHFTQITNTPSRYAYNPGDNGITPTHWKVVVSGSLISVYLNGSDTAAIQVRDNTFTAGQVGFRALAPANAASSFVVDNLSIRGTGPATLVNAPVLKAERFTLTDGMGVNDIVDGFDAASMSYVMDELKWPGVYTVRFTAKGNCLFEDETDTRDLTFEVALDQDTGSDAYMIMNAEITDTVAAVIRVKLADGVADSYDSIVMSARVGSNEAEELAPESSESGYLTFRIREIYSQCMTDRITASVIGRKAGEADAVLCGITGGISVAEYCDLVAEQNPAADKLLAFMANMLSFGSECQKYAGYRTNDLAITGRTWAEGLTGTAAPASSDFEKTYTGNYTGSERISAVSLRIENKISVIFKAIAADPTGVKITVSGDGIDSAEYNLADLAAGADGRYVISVGRLGPDSYDSVITANLTKGAVLLQTVKYSVNTYCKNQVSDTALTSLLTAIYNYGLSAEALRS
ncbi:MAG: hypothetical protein IJS22_06180 [Lachnospiraceae bacterium]|nr:hypothetical protein [Lachnospiraceae bacterium]